ncbi:hypothetical protein JOF48_002953 [Arthrobacter stackebrandtii]|uniref:Nucleotidyltransferase n=1 Tax=Arthrobacter stackebrandtii TaxID=272161 RepID=A0ABS4YZH8_9MICC|nr:hypothetical protein [Arthrobacter stackebrandtii]MBP2414154.1 hypothetical protein [Arthrobacter stackebrandtii]
MRLPGEEVLVETTDEGVPVRVHRNGRLWTVGAEPMRWYERTPWWEYMQRMPKGQGRVDVQVWRVQARLGQNMRSDLVTMDLECELEGGRWRMREG